MAKSMDIGRVMIWDHEYNQSTMGGKGNAHRGLKGVRQGKEAASKECAAKVATTVGDHT